MKLLGKRIPFGKGTQRKDDTSTPAVDHDPSGKGIIRRFKHNGEFTVDGDTVQIFNHDAANAGRGFVKKRWRNLVGMVNTPRQMCKSAKHGFGLTGNAKITKFAAHNINIDKASKLTKDQFQKGFERNALKLIKKDLARKLNDISSDIEAKTRTKYGAAVVEIDRALQAKHDESGIGKKINQKVYKHFPAFAYTTGAVGAVGGFAVSTAGIGPLAGVAATAAPAVAGAFSVAGGAIGGFVTTAVGAAVTTGTGVGALGGALYLKTQKNMRELRDQFSELKGANSALSRRLVQVQVDDASSSSSKEVDALGKTSEEPSNA